MDKKKCDTFKTRGKKSEGRKARSLSQSRNKVTAFPVTEYMKNRF